MQLKLGYVPYRNFITFLKSILDRLVFHKSMLQVCVVLLNAN